MVEWNGWACDGDVRLIIVVGTGCSVTWGNDYVGVVVLRQILEVVGGVVRVDGPFG